MRATLLGLVCAVILAGILAAGLWPFHSPKNDVQWLPAGSGLWIGAHGTLLSASGFVLPPKAGDEACAVEIWLAPASAWNRHTILAFYAGRGFVPFSLHQSYNDLLVERGGRGPEFQRNADKLHVDHVFRSDRSVWIAITSDGRETAVYVNGALAGISHDFAFTRSDLRGEMIVANSPFDNNSWTGLLRGIAIYNHFLTQPVALQHYRSWVEGGRPASEGEMPPAALYLFDQMAGRVVRNEAGQGPNLFVPRRYTVVDQIFLERPWDEFAPSGNYWKDLLINIGGFIPLGLVFCAYFSVIRRRRDAALITILFGAAVSITIEVLQSYLPTRDSGMTDILTNTLGTAAGAILWGRTSLILERLARSRHRQVRALATWLIHGDEAAGRGEPARLAEG